MAQVITLAGERLFALKAQNNQQLDIDTFIFAYVPGQDSTAPIDRNEDLPPVNQRVHQQIVQQYGMLNDNAVVYSSVLDSLTGPFQFNWVGLYSAVNQTLVAIQHIPTVVKTVTEPGASGNILNRNFVIEYSGIAELTGITVDPATWQYDFNARLNGMDELTRQLAADMNGKDWFIGDGFKVVPRSTLNTFKVTAGAGYVSGLRVELAADHILTLSSYQQFVYVDAWFDGTSESIWKGHVAFTVTNTEMDDYIDVNGRNHYVFKLARITAADVVEDLRNISGLGDKIKELQVAEDLKEKTELIDLSTILRSGSTIVLGGDSLSFMPFDWPVPVYQLDYAWKNSPGLMSWSHMLKDLIHRYDVNFVHSDQIPVLKHGDAVLKINPSTETDKYFLPFNNRYVGITAKNNSDVIRFTVPVKKKSNNLRIYLINNHEVEKNGKFDIRVSVYPYSEWVNKGTIITGGRQKFLGLEPFTYDIGDNFEGNYPVLVEFYNFRKENGDVPDSNGVSTKVQAFGEKKTEVKLTGRGGYTSSQILSEFDEMVTDYSPNLIILTIGANDRALGVNSSDVIANIKNMVSRSRANDNKCEIILMTTTKATNQGFAPEDVKNGEKMKDWLDKIKAAALSLGCRYFDLYSLFDNVDMDLWLFDNVHLTKIGNEILFNSFAKKYFQDAVKYSNPELYKTEFQLANFEIDQNDLSMVPSGNITIQFNEAENKYYTVDGTDSVAAISSVEKVDDYIIRINSNYQIGTNINYGRGRNNKKINISISQLGISQITITARVHKIGENYIEFFILNASVTPPALMTDALNNGEKYMVSWC
ncbi:phage tail protein [Shewanella xiamenensis]|uniref:phage tail-collar fiber domain-containing protein n=1 Tax=Shewanella xiamenensis TaxID=332186 RepID=UPI00313C8C13